SGTPSDNLNAAVRRNVAFMFPLQSCEPLQRAPGLALCPEGRPGRNRRQPAPLITHRSQFYYQESPWPKLLPPL
ncbi:MAG: hypothetical protein ACKO2P_05230, partial [Planctomycetota bacterium]